MTDNTMRDNAENLMAFVEKYAESIEPLEMLIIVHHYIALQWRTLRVSQIRRRMRRNIIKTNTLATVIEFRHRMRNL